MGRLIVWIVIVVLLCGGLVWLSRRTAEQPVQRIEKVVPADALPK